MAELSRLAGEGHGAAGGHGAQGAHRAGVEHLGLVGDHHARRRRYAEAHGRIGPVTLPPDVRLERRRSCDTGRHAGYGVAGGLRDDHVGAAVAGHVAGRQAAVCGRQRTAGAVVPGSRAGEGLLRRQKHVEAARQVGLAVQADEVALAVAVDVTGR